MTSEGTRAAGTGRAQGTGLYRAMGWAMRPLAKAPAPLRRAIGGAMGSGGGGTSSVSTAQMVALMEGAGTLPDFSGLDLAALVARQPELGTVTVREVDITGPGGPVPARLYRDVGRDADAALVWVHGGAFIGGDLDMPEAQWTALSLAALGIPVLSLDYRKALGGVHFPAPSDDVPAGWSWAAANAEQLGVEPGALHLGGAGAGGNLVAGVGLRLRDGAGPAPASLLLAYPLVHAVLPPMPVGE